MKNNYNVERPHWVFKKHTRNILNLVEAATYLKQSNSGISAEEKKRMLNNLKLSNYYKPRNTANKLDSMNHRIDGLRYFMFGYADKIEKEKKFIFSPLGNLFLKHLNNEEALSKIFTTMLFGIQFPHPASQPSTSFLLYPFRLIFYLLLDPRLKGVLYNYEIYKYLIYVDKLNSEIYDVLVKNILSSRNISESEKLADLKSKEFVIVKSTYEWQYYVEPLLESMGVIDCIKGKNIVKLFHPQKENSRSRTCRNIHNGYFSLNKTVKDLLKNLFLNYSIFDEPLLLSDSSQKSNDVVKEIYSFYPTELLKDIGEESNSAQVELLRLPKLIEEYSKNPDNKTSARFEDVLEEAFNMFINVDATKLSGPGRTDVECLYINKNKNEKFAVDAKSTANKLSGLNSGRLKHHRDLIGASYTIVVTPRYVPSVKYDIADQQIVIIKANTLSEYFYNYIINDNRDIDYVEIHNIAKKHLGKDISQDIYNLTLNKFG